ATVATVGQRSNRSNDVRHAQRPAIVDDDHEGDHHVQRHERRYGHDGHWLWDAHVPLRPGKSSHAEQLQLGRFQRSALSHFEGGRDLRAPLIVIPEEAGTARGRLTLLALEVSIYEASLARGHSRAPARR